MLKQGLKTIFLRVWDVVWGKEGTKKNRTIKQESQFIKFEWILKQHDSAPYVADTLRAHYWFYGP